jgi:prophage regulatory protein
MTSIDDYPAIPRLIDIPEVTRLTTLRKSAIYELAAKGELRPVKLGAKTTFLEADVVEWINRKVADARQPVVA